MWTRDAKKNGRKEKEKMKSAVHCRECHRFRRKKGGKCKRKVLSLKRGSPIGKRCPVERNLAHSLLRHGPVFGWKKKKRNREKGGKP